MKINGKVVKINENQCKTLKMLNEDEEKVMQFNRNSYIFRNYVMKDDIRFDAGCVNQKAFMLWCCQVVL